MFFILSKIFAGLLFPLPLILVSLLIGLVFYRRRWARGWLALVCLVLYSLALYPVSGFLIGRLEKRYPPLSVNEPVQADAVVMLGGMINPMITSIDGEPEFVDAVDRLFLAQKLVAAGKAPLLIITGGSGLLQQKGVREGSLLAEFLAQRGWLAPAQILSEKESRNTYENAVFTTRMARERGIKKIILVTSAFHMPRSVLCFEAQGLQVIPAPADYYFTGSKNLVVEAVFPAAAALRISTIAIKEYIGLVAYKISGYY
ncbi:MAG: YdcF family protein [Leptospiraceae bacterium]|nr:YdcF family protein [Leptospiraceae bacterium]